jgi:hypothetical protein
MESTQPGRGIARLPDAERAGAPTVALHPTDAAARGLTAEDEVLVSEMGESSCVHSVEVAVTRRT